MQSGCKSHACRVGIMMSAVTHVPDLSVHSVSCVVLDLHVVWGCAS